MGKYDELAKKARNLYGGKPNLLKETAVADKTKMRPSKSNKTPLDAVIDAAVNWYDWRKKEIKKDIAAVKGNDRERYEQMVLDFMVSSVLANAGDSGQGAMLKQRGGSLTHNMPDNAPIGRIIDTDIAGNIVSDTARQLAPKRLTGAAYLPGYQHKFQPYMDKNQITDDIVAGLRSRGERIIPTVSTHRHVPVGKRFEARSGLGVSTEGDGIYGAFPEVAPSVANEYAGMVRADSRVLGGQYPEADLNLVISRGDAYPGHMNPLEAATRRWMVGENFNEVWEPEHLFGDQKIADKIASAIEYNKTNPLVGENDAIASTWNKSPFYVSLPENTIAAGRVAMPQPGNAGPIHELLMGKYLHDTGYSYTRNNWPASLLGQSGRLHVLEKDIMDALLKSDVTLSKTHQIIDHAFHKWLE